MNKKELIKGIRKAVALSLCVVTMSATGSLIANAAVATEGNVEKPITTPAGEEIAKNDTGNVTITGGTVSEAALTEAVAQAEAGKTLTVTATNPVSLATSILQAAKEKGVGITVNASSYTWSIPSITDANSALSTTETTVFGKEGAVVAKYLGTSAAAMQVNFSHSGTLPGLATITIKNVAGNFPEGTKLIYVYYHNEATGKLEKQGGAGHLNADGSVTFNISHCSDYVLSATELSGDSIVVPTTTASNTSSSTTAATTTAATTTATTAKAVASPKTGDATPITFVMVVSILAMCGLVGTVVYRKKFA